MPTTPIQREASSDRVKVFFDSARGALECLRGEADFRVEESVESYPPGGPLRIVSRDEVGPYFFWAVARFRTSRLVGRITYGDRESSINMIVGRIGPEAVWQEEYALWQWANVLGGVDERAAGGDNALTTARVESVTSALGEVFAELWPRIAGAGADVIAAMEAARAEVERASSERLARETHDSTAGSAMAAFHLRDYARAITLLESIADRLTPAERKQLELARKYAKA